MANRAPHHDSAARPAVRALTPSLIREVANEGMSEPDVLAFWFGEPDEVTPAFIRDAGAASLARGETFYTQNFGIPPLREAVARYLGTLHRPTSPASVAVTASSIRLSWKPPSATLATYIVGFIVSRKNG